MTKVTQPETDYRTLQAELDEILMELQQADGDVDSAMQRYERGLKIIEQLKQHLKAAENKVTKLK